MTKFNLPRGESRSEGSGEERTLGCFPKIAVEDHGNVAKEDAAKVGNADFVRSDFQKAVGNEVLEGRNFGFEDPIEGGSEGGEGRGPVDLEVAHDVRDDLPAHPVVLAQPKAPEGPHVAGEDPGNQKMRL